MPDTTLPEQTVYITQSGLARKLGVAPATLTRRLASGALRADGVLLSGEYHEGVIFNAGRLQEIRSLFRQPQLVS